MSWRLGKPEGTKGRKGCPNQRRALRKIKYAVAQKNIVVL